MKLMRRAFKSYVYFLWEMVYESDAQNVLEIGTRNFQSTRTIVSALEEKKSGILTSIDIRNHKSRLEQHLESYWEFVEGDSSKIDTLEKVNKKEYDILLIDGSHEYEIAKSDYEMYSPLVKEKGFILLHDVCNHHCGVPKFWKELNVQNKITFNWGKAAAGVIPGFGIIQK